MLEICKIQSEMSFSDNNEESRSFQPLLLCLPNCNFTSDWLLPVVIRCLLTTLWATIFSLIYYLYLCNKLHETNDNRLLSPKVTVEFWSGLVIGFWLGIYPEAKVRCELELQTRRSAYSQRTHFQSGLFIWLIDWCWRVSSSLCELVCRTTSIFMTWWLPFPRARCQREQEGSCNGFSLQTHAPLLAWYSIILLFTQLSHDWAWEETM